MCLYVYVCACVCVCFRERERERDIDTSVCVYLRWVGGCESNFFPGFVCGRVVFNRLTAFVFVEALNYCTGEKFPFKNWRNKRLI